jgi:hypothetical protein
MRANPDRALLGASLRFAGAAVLGSVVAIRDQLPGQPLGVSIPLSVPAGLAAGWGAAVAAPWPMPAAAVMTAATARHRTPTARPGAVCAAIGLGCIVGTLIEPVTRRPRSCSPAPAWRLASTWRRQPLSSEPVPGIAPPREPSNAAADHDLRLGLGEPHP